MGSCSAVVLKFLICEQGAPSLHFAPSPTSSVGGLGARYLLGSTLGETSPCYVVETLGSILQMGRLRLGGHLGNCRAGICTSSLGPVLWGRACLGGDLGARCQHPLTLVGCGLRPDHQGDRATRGGPGGFLLPFRLLGSGASWGEITSSPSCPPPPQLPLPVAPVSLPRAQWWGW